MKTTLAVLTFALVAGQSLPDRVRSMFIPGVAPRPAAPTVTVTPSNFGSNLRPGDHVAWVVDVQNTTGTTIGYLLIAQTTSNLSIAAPQGRCLTPSNCADVSSTTDGSGGAASVVMNAPPGSHATITEDATILAEGAFSVTVKTASNSDNTKDQTVVASLPGQTGPSTTTVTSNSTDPGTGLSNASNSVEPPSAGQPIRVTWDFGPHGPYQVGESVTANFAFWNDGDAPQTITVLGNTLRGLQLGDYPRCGPRCSFVVPARDHILWSVDAAIVDGPGSRAPSGFSDTLLYRVGDGEETSTTAYDKLGAGFPLWLAVVGVVLAAAAATALGVNNARRKWWDRHIDVNAEAHADEAIGKPDEIREYVVVHVEAGAAAPRGPIPITRIDLDG
jgi:hypothetical protein